MPRSSRSSSAPRRAGSALALLCLGILAASTARSQESGGVNAAAGRPVSEVIDDWRRRGVPFAYSTELLDETIVVLEEPEADDPQAMINAILAPHGLRLHEVEGLLVVGRALESAASAAPQEPPTPPAREPALPELTVSASRYEILRERLDAPSIISQRTIQQLPVLGEDPLRSLQRLPGSASNGASAKSHLRGSAERDTGLILNGQRLLDPFHVRDYQNLFSAINARAIGGVEVYTGGFPAKYGDGMGGLVLIDTISPDSDRLTEIGVSVFNSLLLSAGRVADDDLEWLVSARRGNLDLVLDRELGEPSYNDVFAEIGVNLSPRTRLAVNALIATDNVIAVTESDPEERESSTNDTRNAQFWVNWSRDWNPALSSLTTFSVSSFRSTRSGAADDPQEIVASVDDRREIDIRGIQQDWSYEAGDRHSLSWGLSYRYVDANFRYRGAADYFGAFAAFEGVPTTIRRSFDRAVNGSAFGAYLSDRWRLGRNTIAQLGVRWDDQDYVDSGESRALSPRLSLLHTIGKHTDLRLSAGRYHQAHGINDLQIEDGLVEYRPAERADQIIAGVEHRLDGRLSYRIEAYLKDLSRLRPRYENVLDPLAVMPELKPDRVEIAATEARARGIELSLAYEGEGAFSGWLTYTLAQAQDRLADGYVPRGWDQRHAGQFGILWEADRWELSTVVTAHSGWPKTNVEIAPGSDPGDPALTFSERNRDTFRPFATLDARVGYRAPVRYGELSLFFELSNATDRNNPCCVDFELDEDAGPQPILLQSDEFWLPLLPAAGFLWQF